MPVRAPMSQKVALAYPCVGITVFPGPRIVSPGAVESTTSQFLNGELGDGYQLHVSCPGGWVTGGVQLGANEEAPTRACIARSSQDLLSRGGRVNYLTVNERSGLYRGRPRGRTTPHRHPTEEVWALPDPGGEHTVMLSGERMTGVRRPPCTQPLQWPGDHR